MHKRIFLILLLPFFLTGCWDKRDPEDRAFIMTLGVDASDTGCTFSFAPANTGEGEAKTYTADSDTLAGAVAQVDYQMSRKTDLGQLKTVIFGVDVLKDTAKLESILQELERSQSVSEKVMLLATENKAADCVETVLQADSKTGLFLWDFYKNTAQEVATTKSVDLDTFLTERTEQGGNAVLPRISVTDESLDLGGGVAVAADAAYPLTNEEERGYLFLLGEAEGALLEGAYDGEILPLRIGKTNARYEFSPRSDGRLLCTIHLPLEGTLQGGEGFLLSPKRQQEITTIFETIIKEEVAHTMNVSRRAHKDLFGILPRLEQNAPQLSLGIPREQLWQALEFEIRPELELKDVGRKR